MSNLTRQSSDLALCAEDGLLYCAQFNKANDTTLLLNRNYNPLWQSVRNPDTEAAATFHCKRSESLIHYCKGDPRGNDGYFFEGSPPDQNSPEYADLIRRINVFMSSGLYPNQESFLNSFEGEPLELMLRDATRMLPPLEADAFETFVKAAMLIQPEPTKFVRVSRQLIFDNLGFQQSEEFINSLVRDHRFFAVAAHVGATIFAASDGPDFLIEIDTIFDAKMQRAKPLNT